MVSHVKPLVLIAREGRIFLKREREVGKTVVNTVQGFALAESFPGKKRSLSSIC